MTKKPIVTGAMMATKGKAGAEPEEDEKRTGLTFRATETRYEKLRKAAYMGRTSIQGVLEALVDEHLPS